jgi:Family of unknown function (DUF6152)
VRWYGRAGFAAAGRAGAEPSRRQQGPEIKDTESAMKKRAGIVGLVVFGFWSVSVPLFAHHGNASFESKLSTVTGTVTEYFWANPHVLVKLDAKDDSGKTLHWIVEAQNTVSMRDIGWKPDTFKPGDVVSIDVNQAKNGRLVGSTGGSSPTAAKRRIIINGKQFQ